MADNIELQEFLDLAGVEHLWGRLKEKFGDGVFIATYGETTLEEIGEAELAGKLLVCNFTSMMLPIASGIRGIFYNFYGGTDEDGYMATIQSDGTWTYTKYDGYTPKAHTHKIAKPARKVVGTSASGWTADDCDYLCDGTADEVEINAAINALPSTGGEVILLDGTYTIAAQIKVGVANVTLRGNGNGTTIVRGFDASRMIYVSYSNVTVEKLKLDGAKDTYTDTSNHGIYSLAAKTTIRDCMVTDCAGDGIYLTEDYGKAIGNTVTGCDSGIYASGEQCILSNNILLENAKYGISIQDNHIVATGNIAKLNGTANMYMFYALNCTITGNDFSVMDGDSVTPKAIYLYGSYSDDNIIVNNQVGVGTVDGGSGTGNIVCNPGYTYGTTDITAGSASTEPNGTLHFVIE